MSERPTQAEIDELQPCPFCGDIPYFSEVMEKDDRRYMQRNLICCVSMRTTIGYGRFKNMTDKAIEAELTESLIKQWNARNKPEIDEANENFDVTRRHRT